MLHKVLHPDGPDGMHRAPALNALSNEELDQLLQHFGRDDLYSRSQSVAACELLLLLRDEIVLGPAGLGATVLLQGTAGTGKSHLVKAFFAAVREPLGLNVALFSGMGKAALESGGDTLDGALFALSAACGPSMDYLVQALQKPGKLDFLRRLHVLIIEESGQQGLRRMAMLDVVLRAVTGLFDVPYGGRVVLLCGEVLQLPPVGNAVPMTVPLSSLSEPLLRSAHMALFPAPEQAPELAEGHQGRLAPGRRTLQLMLLDQRRFLDAQQFEALQAFSVGAHSLEQVQLIASSVIMLDERVAAAGDGPVLVRQVLAHRCMAVETARQLAHGLSGEATDGSEPPLTRDYLCIGTRVRCSMSVRAQALYAGMTGTVVGHVVRRDELLAVVVNFDTAVATERGFIVQRENTFFSCGEFRQCAIVSVRERMKCVKRRGAGNALETTLAAGRAALQSASGSTIHACQGTTFAHDDGSKLLLHLTAETKRSHHALKYVPLSRPVDLSRLVVAGVTRAQFERALMRSRPSPADLRFVRQLSESALGHVQHRVAELRKEDASGGALLDKCIGHAASLEAFIALVERGLKMPPVGSHQQLPMLRCGLPGPADDRADLEPLLERADRVFETGKIELPTVQAEVALLTHAAAFDTPKAYGDALWKAALTTGYMPLAFWLLFERTPAGRAAADTVRHHYSAVRDNLGALRAAGINKPAHIVELAQRFLAFFVERTPELAEHAMRPSDSDEKRLRDNGGAYEVFRKAADRAVFWSVFGHPNGKRFDGQKSERQPAVPSLMQLAADAAALEAPGQLLQLATQAAAEGTRPAPTGKRPPGRPPKSRRKKK